MSSVVAFQTSVPSGSGTRRRRHGSDSDSSAIKIPRGNFYFVLESESDIPTSEEDETESVISLQNKSTDFAKDTSDTCSKTSHEFEIEFEVVSPSESEAKAPFDTSSSGAEMEPWRKRLFFTSGSDASDRDEWADDDSSAECHQDLYKIPVRLRSCLKCRAPTPVHYCQKCYKVRKDFFPPRPAHNKRKKVTRPTIKKSLNEPPKDEKVESGIESSCSQEIFLTPEEKPNVPPENESLCNVCFKNQKDGAFVHCRWVHIYACYECSVKIWFSSKCCPLCKGKVNKVLKVAMG